VITQRTVSAADWETATGWHLDDSGWCSGDRCVPAATVRVGDATAAEFDTVRLAAACSRATVIDEKTGTVAVGPAFGSIADSRLGHPIADVALIDRDGSPVSLQAVVASSTALGRRVIVHAWAPW
jgi:hypothetical protein